MANGTLIPFDDGVLSLQSKSSKSVIFKEIDGDSKQGVVGTDWYQMYKINFVTPTTIFNIDLKKR